MSSEKSNEKETPSIDDLVSQYEKDMETQDATTKKEETTESKIEKAKEAVSKEEEKEDEDYWEETSTEEELSDIEQRKVNLLRMRQMSAPSSPEEAEYATGQFVVATNLSPQLGSDPTSIGKGKFDMRRLSIIDDDLQAALSYFAWRGKSVRFWQHIVDSYLNLSPSIKGVGRKQLIEMQRATTPGLGPEPEPESRSWVERNITKRGGEE